jgi:hypothetical protein
MTLLRRWSTLLLVLGHFGCGGGDKGGSTFTPAGTGTGVGSSSTIGSGGSAGSGFGGSIINSTGTGGSGTMPGGTLMPDGAVCAGEVHGVETVPMNMFIMLDRSVSMLDNLNGTSPPTRWDAMTKAILDYLVTPEARQFHIGLQYFPQFDTNGATSCDAARYSTPAVPIGPITDPAVVTALSNSIRGTMPNGFTPSAPALQGALAYAKQYAMANAGRPTIVVLATDGYPTECMPTSTIEIANTIVGPALASMPSIRTFVIAAGGGAGGLSSLKYVSTAGGTGDPILVADGADTSEQIKTALQRLSRKNLICSYKIPAPDGGRADPGQVNVDVTLTGMPRMRLPYFLTADGCGTMNGWFYDDVTKPTNIHLCPATCNSLFNAEIDIVVGCAGPKPM